MIDNIKVKIQCLKGDIGVEFQRWYDEAKQLASYIGTEEEMSKVPMIQCNSSKVPADTPLLHYKISIGIPFIDILLQQLQIQRAVSALLSLIPYLIAKLGMLLAEKFESWHDDLLTQRLYRDIQLVQHVVMEV